MVGLDCVRRCTRLAVLLVGSLVGMGGAYAQESPLPPHAWKRYGTTALRHGSQIQCLAFAPNSKLVAAGGGDDGIRLWNVDNLGERKRLKDNWAACMVFAGDGTLVTAGPFKKIRLWDIGTLREKGFLEGHQSPVKVLALSRDSKLLASGSQDGTVLVWTLAARRKALVLGHFEEITAMAFSPDGSLLATASGDRTVRVWNTATTEKLLQLEAGCTPLAVIFSKDGKLIISAGDDNLIRCWDAGTGKAVEAFKGHSDSVVSLLLAGTTLVSGSRDGTIRLWDLAALKPGRVLKRCPGDALAVSSDGKLLAHAGPDNVVHVIDVESGMELDRHEPAAPVLALGLSRDGKILVSAGSDHVVNQWSTADGKNLHCQQAGPPGDLTVPLALTGMVNGNALKLAAQIESKNDAIVASAASADGKVIAVSRRSGLVVLQLHDGDKVVLQQLRYPGTPNVLAFSRDGKLLAVTGSSKVIVFDVAAARAVQQCVTREGPPPTQPIGAALAFAPDGKTLAVGCYDGIARLFDVASGKQTVAFEGHASAILAVAFSPDGRTLATGSFDHTLRLWETSSGQSIASFTGHIGPVNAVCFAPDGRSFYSGSSDTTMLRWDATRISNNLVLPVIVQNNAELDNAWRRLAVEEAANGRDIVWRLIATRDSAAYLGTKLFYVDAKQIDRLFADLDDNSFVVRSKATDVLGSYIDKYGMWMRGRFEETIKNAPSEEVRHRCEQLLEKLMQQPAPLSLAQERVRIHRVMMVLEQVGGPAAVEVLEKMANGAPEKNLQREAQISLKRLKNR